MQTREEFVNEMAEADMTNGDLQGCVEARCMCTGEDENALLDEIRERMLGGDR